MPDRPAILVFAYHDVGHECLDALIRRGEKIIAVFTHQDDPNEEVWFRSVANLARRSGIPVYTAITGWVFLPMRWGESVLVIARKK